MSIGQEVVRASRPCAVMAMVTKATRSGTGILPALFGASSWPSIDVSLQAERDARATSVGARQDVPRLVCGRGPAFNLYVAHPFLTMKRIQGQSRVGKLKVAHYQKHQERLWSNRQDIFSRLR